MKIRRTRESLSFPKVVRLVPGTWDYGWLWAGGYWYVYVGRYSISCRIGWELHARAHRMRHLTSAWTLTYESSVMGLSMSRHRAVRPDEESRLTIRIGTWIFERIWDRLYGDARPEL
jgi:hypothetical protein